MVVHSVVITQTSLTRRNWNICQYTSMALYIQLVVISTIVTLLIGSRMLQTSQASRLARSSSRVSCSPVESIDGNCNFFTAKYSTLVDDERQEITDGLPFNFNASYLRRLGFPIIFNNTMKRGTTTVEDFVFLTAADVGYFEVSMNAIATVQKHFPRQKIIFYDLAPANRSQSLVQKIKEMCNVDYRAFNFLHYPRHVQNLRNYAWKPLVIHDALLSHDLIFWMDSSVRFRSHDFTIAVNRTHANGGGPVMFDFSGHSIFAATHSGMFDYLPMDRNSSIEYGMFSANAMVFRRTHEIYDAVIRWWFLCAMTVNCMAPTMNLSCHFSKTDRKGTYALCHRFDQSALNILTVNHLTNRYLRRSDRNMTSLVSTVSSEKSGNAKVRASPAMVAKLCTSPGPVKIARGSKQNHNVSICNAAETSLGNGDTLIPIRSHFNLSATK